MILMQTTYLIRNAVQNAEMEPRKAAGKTSGRCGKVFSFYEWQTLAVPASRWISLVVISEDDVVSLVLLLNDTE